MRAKTSVAFVVVLLWLSVTPLITHAEDKYWVGGNGSWDDANNWSLMERGPGGAGAPQPGETAFLIQSDAIDRTVSYVRPEDPYWWFYELRVDATGTGRITFLQSQDDLYLPDGGSVSIGIDGTATYNQTGGRLSLGHALVNDGLIKLGINPTGNGTYNLEGGLLGLYGVATVGGYGTGTFNQSGGSAYFEGVVIGDKGTYNISDGSVGMGGENLGVTVNPGGAINQSGGTVYLSADNSMMGTYNLSGGTLNKGSQTLDISGTFNQSGGTLAGGYSTLDISGTFNQSGGTNVVPTGYGPYNWGTSNSGTYNLSGGILTFVDYGFFDTGIENSGTFNYSGGSMVLTDPRPDPDPSFVGFNNSGTFNLSGSGTRTVEGNILNTGTVKTTHTTAVYNGTFTNNGAYISDPAVNYFEDLTIGEKGYLVGGAYDHFYISGDFENHSLMDIDWATEAAHLAFIHDINILTDKGDMLHDFYLTGSDYGASLDGYANNFAWGTLDVTDNYLTFYDGNSEEGAALYLRELWGLGMSDELITNLFGFDGLNVYYMAQLPGNSYLGGLTYELSGGGYLRPIVPEPSTMLLVGTSLIALVGFRRRFKG